MAVTNEQMTYSIEVKNASINSKLSESIEKAEDLDAAMESLQDTVKETSKTEEQYQKALKKSADTMQSSSDNISRISQSTENLNKSFEETRSTIQNLTVAISGVSIAVAGLKKAYEIISDPRTLAAAQDILVILQATAAYKGFDRLAESIEIARKKLETLAEAVDKFRNSGDMFQKLSEAADTSRMFLLVTQGLGIVTKAIAATIAGIAGFSIFQTISKEGLNFQKILSGIRQTFSNVFQISAEGFSALITRIKSTRITIENLHDAFTLFSVGGTVVGTTNLLAGGLEGITIASLKASAASIAFGLALKGVIILVGDLIQSIGQRLGDAMSSFQEKFAKTQQIVTQFGFVVKNFGNAYGEAFIGTLYEWENQIERLANTTTFSSNELRKSAKLVIAENKALGLSYEANVKFLDRAVEIAASSGLELFDVVQRLQSALVGNGTAVAALGINLGAHALEHSLLNKTIQKTIGTMTEQEKQQIALYEIYKQTEPLVGSSIKQGETIIGINQQLANSYEQIQSKLGSVNAFSMALSSTYADLVRNVSNLPQVFFDIAGTAGDLGSIILQVVGFTLKWILVIATLVTAYKILNVIIMTNIVLQTKLNTVAKFLGLTFQFQAAKVTTASAALAIMGKVLKGGVLFILSNVTTALKGATVAVGNLTLAVLTNPLFLKAAAIASAIFLVIKAFDELNQEMNVVDDVMADFQGTVAEIKAVFTATGKVAVSAFSTIVQVIKILILGVAELYNYLKLAYYGVRRLFDPKNAAQYNNAIDATLNSLDTLALSHTKALTSIASNFSKITGNSTAYGQTLDANAELLDELALKQTQLNKASAEIDFSTIRIEVLGTEVEKLTNRYTLASKSVEKLTSEILNASEMGTDAIKDYKKALEDQANAGAQLDKFRIDSLKSIADITREVQKESMRLASDETAQLNAEFEERRQSVMEFEKQLSRLGPIAGASAKTIIDAYRSIEAGRKNAIKALQDKADQEANENYLKFLKEQNDLLDDIAKRNRDLQMDSLGDSLTQRQKINEMLRFDSEELEKQIAHYRTQWGAQSAVVQALMQQKGLLKEAAEAQRDLAEMELPDWMDGLGDSINNLFGRKNIDDFFAYIKEKADSLAANPILLQVQQVGAQVGPGPVGQGMAKVGDAIAKGADALFNAGGALSSVLQSAGGWVGALIDVFLNADKYLNILIESPKMFLKVIQNLPGLIQKFIDTFPSMIRAIAEALPGIILKIVDMIPNFIAAFLDAIPLLIERLAEAIPEIFVKLVAMLPRLIVMIGRAMFLAVQSFVKGLIRGIANLFKGVKIPRVEISTKGVEAAAKKLSGSASRLFQVNDLMDAAKDPLQKLTDELEEAFKKGSNWFKEAWNWINEKIIQPFFNLLKDAWMWVWDKIIAPIANLLKNAWMWIYEKILQPVMDGFKAVFQWVNDKIFQPIIEGFKKVFTWISDNVFKPVTAALKSVFDALAEALTRAFSWLYDNVVKPLSEVGEKIAKPIVDAFQGIMSMFSGLGEALKSLFKLDFSGVKEALQGVFEKGGDLLKDAFKGVINPIVRVFNGLIDVLNAMVIPGVRWSVSAGKLGSWSGQLFDDIDLIPGDISKLQTLASGGLIESGGMGLAGFGTDTVGVAATPGEFLVNRRGVDTAGLGALTMLNRGVSAAQGGGTYHMNFEINIDAPQKMDEGYIRGTLVPKMKEELKRASLDGQFVLSSRGIR